MNRIGNREQIIEDNFNVRRNKEASVEGTRTEKRKTREASVES